MNKANLDLIIEFRSLREKKLAKELIIIWNRLNMKKEELNLIKNKRQWLLFNLRNAQKNLVDIYRIELAVQYISKLDKEIQKIEDEIREIKKEYEKKLNQLLEATKQRKIVEKLKEKWIEKQKYENLRKEQSFLDEIASNSFIYKNA